MIKKYIKGNVDRGSDVIKELEKLGGKNLINFEGTDQTSYYFINTSMDIQATATNHHKELIRELFEEIILPPKFVSKEITFYTSPTIDNCEGCFFNSNPLFCIVIAADNNCLKDNFIYKLKQ